MIYTSDPMEICITLPLQQYITRTRERTGSSSQHRKTFFHSRQWASQSPWTGQTLQLVIRIRTIIQTEMRIASQRKSCRLLSISE